MAHIVADRVKDTTTTTGTGAVTLSNAAPSSYRTFGSVCENSDTVHYCIAHQSANEWEVGLGTYSTTGPTITRTTVVSSSNSNAAVNFSAGTKDVFLTVPAATLGNGYFGGVGSLTERLSTISNFASPNAGGVVTGQYYDNSFQGTASSTLIGAANRWDMAPYYTSVPLSIDRIGCSVSTAVAASNFKITIYDSDSSGWPNNRLYESGDLSGASTGFVEATLSFTFVSGRQYWIGVRHSSTCTLRTINVSSAVNLGLTSSNAANYATILRRTLTYATAATDPYVFTNSDRTANVTPPSIRFRAA